MVIIFSDDDDDDDAAFSGLLADNKYCVYTVYVYKRYQKLYRYFLVALMKENESDRDGHAGPW